MQAAATCAHASPREARVAAAIVGGDSLKKGHRREFMRITLGSPPRRDAFGPALYSAALAGAACARLPACAWIAVIAMV